MGKNHSCGAKKKNRSTENTESHAHWTWILHTLEE